MSPVDLDAVRRRLERALELAPDLVPDGVRDERKLYRGTYILIVNDVPKLLAELAHQRDAAELERDEARAEIEHHRRTIRAYVEATQGEITDDQS